MGRLRKSGRTTRIALETISTAMKHPGEIVLIRDHHRTFAADRNLRSVIQGILLQLNLKGFHISNKAGNLRLTYVNDWSEL